MGADPWIYAVLARFDDVDGPYVGGRTILSLSPYSSRPEESVGYRFHTPFGWDSRYDGYGFELIGLRTPPDGPQPERAPGPIWPMIVDPKGESGDPFEIAVALRCVR